MAFDMSLLPRVSESTRIHLIESISAGWIDHGLETISESNPTLGRWIYRFSKKSPDYFGSVYSGVLVYEMLEEHGPLPEVSQKTAGSVISDISIHNGGYLNNLLDKINAENPVIADFLVKFMWHNHDSFVAYSGGIVYDMLDRQAKVNASLIYPKTWKLRKQLEYAIAEEKYEDAAMIRDNINTTDEPL